MDESTRSTSPIPASTWLRYALCKPANARTRRALRACFCNDELLGRYLQNGARSPTSEATGLPANAVSVLQAMQQEAISSRLADTEKWLAQSPLHHLIGLDHPHYPPLLRNTSDPPPALFVSGSTDILQTPCIAIVGARKATKAALAMARTIAQGLSDAGVTVVSGLALGIDAAAHSGALAGPSSTIAVAATAANRVYPAAHRPLAADIRASGAVVTEFPLHSQLRPGCFPRRNRLISGISHGVLVVEAALPSGTLTTAEHALQQGREVMAVPGSVNNPLSRGCHHLLRQGAALVESADDVLATLATDLSRIAKPAAVAAPAPKPTRVHAAATVASQPDPLEFACDEPDAMLLLDCLGFDHASVDTLAERTGLSPARVTGALTILELTGDVAMERGGRYSRCKHSRTGG